MRHNDIVNTKKFVDEGLDMYMTFKNPLVDDRYSAFVQSIRYGKYDIFRVFLDDGAKISGDLFDHFLTTGHLNTDFSETEIKIGQIKILHLLYDTNANIELEKDLIAKINDCLYYNRLDIFKFLYERTHIDQDILNRLLKKAVKKNNIKFCEFLLSNGATITNNSIYITVKKNRIKLLYLLLNMEQILNLKKMLCLTFVLKMDMWLLYML